MYLRRPDKDAEHLMEDPDARVLSRKKSNYARINEDLTLFLQNGIFVAGLNGLDQHSLQVKSQAAEKHFWMSNRDEWSLESMFIKQ